MGAAPDASAAAKPPAWQPRNSIPLLVGLLHVMVAGWGAHRAVSASTGAEGSALPIVVLTIAFSIVAVATCNADARQRGSPLPHSLQYVMLMTWPLAIPVYLIETRRWLGLVWSALWSTTLVLCAVAGAFSSFVLMWLTR